MIWEYENRARRMGFTSVAGVDEAGRGPLAGPVVSAAVILPVDFLVEGIADSKKLSPKKREFLFRRIQAEARAVNVGICSHEEIDRINILRASLMSMVRAVEDLKTPPDYLLIDGSHKIPSEIPQEAVVKGDALSISIGAASIIAKVTRDRIMAQYHETYPQYGFAGHKGYPTAAHREAVRRHGPCPIHRLTFKGVKEYAQ